MGSTARTCDPVTRYCACPVEHPALLILARRTLIWWLLPGRAQGWLTGPPCFGP